MKIANVGDLHLGGPRRSTWERVMLSIADDAENRGADLFVVSGDWHDARSDEHVRLFDRLLVERITSYAQLLVVGGNHDVEKDLLILDSFARAYPVHVYDEPGVASLDLAGERLDVACLADLRATYLKARLARMVKGSTSINAAREVLRELAAKMGTGSHPRLFVGHLTLGGARMDNDQPARASEFALPLSDLALIQAHAYVLGHIHLRQSWMIGDSPVFYTGSPYSTNFGELAPKSWTMLHWNGKGFDVEIIPTIAPRLVLLTGTWKRDGDETEMVLAYDEAHATDKPVVLSELKDADVRFRFTTPTDDKVGVKRVVESLQSSVLAAGALACALDPRPALSTRSRASALGQAKSIPDKVDAFWRATNTWPDAARRDRIHALLARHMEKVPPPPPVSLVRANKVEWRGLGNLVEHGAILAGRTGVQTIVGPNQAGKSTLLSLLSAGMWGEGPKGSLDALSRGKGSRLALDVTTAHGTWKLDHEVDRKTTTVWEEGTPIVSGRAPFKRWANTHLPSLDVLEQTSLLPPEGKGLLGLIDRPLKAALLTLAGATIYDSLHEGVSDGRRELNARMKNLAQSIARTGDPFTALTAAKNTLAECQARLADLREEHAAFEAHTVRVNAFGAEVAERDRLADRIRALTERQQTIEASIDRAADAEKIRTSFAHAQKERIRFASLAEKLSVEEAAFDREEADLREQITRSQNRVDVESARAERLAQRLTEKAECEQAEIELQAALDRLLRAEESVTRATEAQSKSDMRSTVERIRLTAMDARLRPSVISMERGLVQIRDMADVALAASPNGSPLTSALGERTQASRAHARVERLAARLPSFAEDEADHALALSTVEEEEGMVAMLSWRHHETKGRLAAVRASHIDASREAKRWASEEKRLAASLPSGDLSHAQGMLVAVEEQLADALMDQAAHGATLAASEASVKAGLQPPAWKWCAPTSERGRSLPRLIEHEARAISKIEVSITTHEQACEQAILDQEDLDVAERDHGDLTEAIRVLSRDGIQAFEADEIGREIADDATELLQRHDFRWVLTYEPLRGEGIEQARWMLTELDTGTSYDARHRGGGSSGGQETIVVTAIALAAQAAVVRRGGGVPDAVMTIDETAGAVRGELVEPWLAMLRDGAERAGVKVVLLVPPNDQRLIDACDGVITVTPEGAGSTVR